MLAYRCQTCFKWVELGEPHPCEYTLEEGGNIKNPFKRGKITTPQCPVCGKYMDKALVTVNEQLAQGTAPVGVTTIGWVCPGTHE